jgi:cyclophilin family peptidyl-prolyl cis-trans isomerase
MRLNRAAATVAAVLLLAGCTSGAASSAGPIIAPSASAASSAAAGSSDLASCPTSQPAAMPAGTSKLVTMTTAKGTIVIKVEGALSPIAAGNFVALAQCGYYTGVVFHRLVPGFVIQGGDGTYGREPNVDMTRLGSGGPGYNIADEPVIGTYTRGTVAMAKTSQPNSANSQFFIVLADVQLDPTYQIFGHVTSGMDAVDAIAAMPNSGGDANMAINPVAMDKVTVSNP